MAPNIYTQTCSLNPARSKVNFFQQKCKEKSTLEEQSGEDKVLEKLLHMMSAGMRKLRGKMGPEKNTGDKMRCNYI